VERELADRGKKTDIPWIEICQSRLNRTEIYQTWKKKTDIAWTELDQTENSWSGCLSDRY